jgi:hypothetical protein
MSIEGTVYLDKNLCRQNDVVCTPTVVTCEISVPFNAYASVVDYSSLSSERGHLQGNHRATPERVRKARLEDSALCCFISYPPGARP